MKSKIHLNVCPSIKGPVNSFLIGLPMKVFVPKPKKHVMSFTNIQSQKNMLNASNYTKLQVTVLIYFNLKVT